MRVNKFLMTMALSCGLMALPALAQTSTSTPDQQTPSAAQSGAISNPNSAQQPTSSASSDSATIQTNVQSALQKDDQLAGQNVNVMVNSKNQIVLTGTVSTQAQKDHAEQVATQTAGSGYTVKNHIKVSSSGAQPQ